MTGRRCRFAWPLRDLAGACWTAAAVVALVAALVAYYRWSGGNP